MQEPFKVGLLGHMNKLGGITFCQIEEKHEDILRSQWIPMDRELWRIENHRKFLGARRALLAEETNKRGIIDDS
ncbi:MAG: hypothetical protein F4Y00_06715 [Bacteroidetes bacterium SB0662_bin_6]|nr:hypothetical protein [Bacteroidetes bacterium SB0668_bin_1]MYE04643.1 hypothetical protein [Bacteroidetes bacterium SB0662_bin_6]